MLGWGVANAVREEAVVAFAFVQLSESGKPGLHKFFYVEILLMIATAGSQLIFERHRHYHGCISTTNIGQ